MGQQALLHAGHHYDGELQPFGLVQGNQGQGVVGGFVVVHIGDQGNAFQESAQPVGGGVGGGAVFLGKAAQFLEVFPAFFAVVLGVDLPGQTGQIQGAVEEVGDAEFAGGVAEAVQGCGQVGHGAGGAGG